MDGARLSSRSFPLRLGYVASLVFTAFLLSCFLSVFLLLDVEVLADGAA